MNRLKLMRRRGPGFFRLVSWAVLSLLGLPVLSSETEQNNAARFEQCIQRLQNQAQAEGISSSTRALLDEIQPVPRVLELDRSQPEFTQTFAGYLNRRVTSQRVEQGRALYSRHQALLQRIQRETGVPGHYLVAFWGLETGFGSHFGAFPVTHVLTTLACDERRSEYFGSELMHALHILDADHIRHEDMLGSWAGAMGHVQFMPSVFRRHAMDGDDDGRIDIWGSVTDALTSAGAFLEGIGWQSGERWGREVLLPDDFPYERAGRQRSAPLSEWRSLGVRMTNGEPLPDLDMDGAVLVPSGHRGPAFLVYDNFEVILRWNRSEFFALAVGHLADRIAGAAPLQQPPPETEPLSRSQVVAIQERLNVLGHEAGEADGVFGPATRGALSAFQDEQGLVADGHPDTKTVDLLLQD